MRDTERVLREVRHGRKVCSLAEPYVLSFATIHEISSLWVRVVDDRGETGWGEAVPLPGYADDDEEGISRELEALCPMIEGETLSSAASALLSRAGDAPFAVSALASAVDMLTWPKPPQGGLSLPLVFPLAATADPGGVVGRMEKGVSAGYRHFKMKVGRDVDEDIECAKAAAAAASAHGSTLRFDANQGYGIGEARRFCAEMEGDGNASALWLEQPLGVNDWDGMEKLCRETAFPLTLDEPIYGPDDVDRAAAIGCAGVKLKLIKHPGMNATLELARRASGLGLKVVLGNGVATDIGNYCEALIIGSEPDLFIPGAECNGFLKIEKCLSFQGIAEVKGSLVIRPAL